MGAGCVGTHLSTRNASIAKKFLRKSRRPNPSLTTYIKMDRELTNSLGSRFNACK
jgi:hypothetical protein